MRQGWRIAIVVAPAMPEEARSDWVSESGQVLAAITP
jgi:hypothetical protein